MRTICVLIAGTFAAGCAASRNPRAPRLDPGGATFLHAAPGATDVRLVGSFDGWESPGLPLESEDGRLWKRRLTLKPGRYSYSFVVDGRNVGAPDAPLVEDDGFGGKNGVLEIR